MARNRADRGAQLQSVIDNLTAKVAAEPDNPDLPPLLANAQKELADLEAAAKAAEDAAAAKAAEEAAAAQAASEAAAAAAQAAAEAAAAQAASEAAAAQTAAAPAVEPSATTAAPAVEPAETSAAPAAPVETSAAPAPVVPAVTTAAPTTRRPAPQLSRSSVASIRPALHAPRVFVPGNVSVTGETPGDHPSRLRPADRPTPQGQS